MGTAVNRKVDAGTATPTYIAAMTAAKPAATVLTVAQTLLDSGGATPED
jgi:hypothetical protein